MDRAGGGRPQRAVLRLLGLSAARLEGEIRGLRKPAGGPRAIGRSDAAHRLRVGIGSRSRMTGARKPTEYDRRARLEIEEWKRPSNTLVRRVGRAVTKPLELGTEVLLDNTPLGAAVKGMLELLNDGAIYTVPADPVYAHFRSNGHRVNRSSDIANMRLQDVDEAVGFLATRYMAVAGTEGGAAGAAWRHGAMGGSGGDRGGSTVHCRDSATSHRRVWRLLRLSGEDARRARVRTTCSSGRLLTRGLQQDSCDG